VHRTTTKEVDVEVENGLPCASSGIDDGAIPGLSMTLIIGNSRADTQQVSEQRFISV